MPGRPRKLVVPAGALRLGEWLLPADIARYVAKVLRQEPGAHLELSDGAGTFAAGTILRIRRDEVVVQVRTVWTTPFLEPELVVLQGLAKGEKMDRLVRQATELGVSRIVPVHCDRSVPEGKGRSERWRAIAEDAVRVSGRGFRPEIAEVMPVGRALADVSSELRIVLTPNASEGLGKHLCARSGMTSAAILVGPEGGLTEAEVSLAEMHGFLAAHLGARVLRTETAGVAVLAVLQFVLGGFDLRLTGGPPT